MNNFEKEEGGKTARERERQLLALVRGDDAFLGVRKGKTEESEKA